MDLIATIQSLLWLHSNIICETIFYRVEVIAQKYQFRLSHNAQTRYYKWMTITVIASLLSSNQKSRRKTFYYYNFADNLNEMKAISCVGRVFVVCVCVFIWHGLSEHHHDHSTVPQQQNGAKSTAVANDK